MQSMKTNQAGFTVVELLICILGFGAIGLTLFVVGHFIAKFW